MDIKEMVFSGSKNIVVIEASFSEGAIVALML